GCLLVAPFHQGVSQETVLGTRPASRRRAASSARKLGLACGRLAPPRTIPTNCERGRIPLTGLLPSARGARRWVFLTAVPGGAEDTVGGLPFCSPREENP